MKKDMKDNRICQDDIYENETVAQRLTRIANSSDRKSMIQGKIDMGDKIIHTILMGSVLVFCVYLIFQII